MKPVVGVIGLGAMGQGMAQSLRRAGFDLQVFDVRAGVADRLRPRRRHGLRQRGRAGRSCDVVVSVVVNAAQTEDVLFGSGNVAASMPAGSVFVMCSTVDPNWSVALEARLAERGPAVPRCADLRRRRQGRQRPDDDDDLGPARGLRALRRRARCHGRQGLPAGRPRRRRQQGEDHQPAAGRRAHRRRRRGHGAGPARRRGCGGAVRGHHAQRRQQLDVREPHGACAGRRLHAAVGGGHLRQGPGPGARHGARQQVPAAAVEHRAPDVHAGLDRRLRQARTTAR